MKVILLQDVAKIGRRNEVVTVPDGYGLNQLVPKGMAIAATPENIKQNKAQAAKADADRSAHDAAFTTAVEVIKEKKITVAVEANDQGHLFEALKADKVVSALEAEGVVVTADQVHIGTPIKEVGEHSISLVSGTVTSALVIIIEAA